jgi:hypothetical protein
VRKASASERGSDRGSDDTHEDAHTILVLVLVRHEALEFVVRVVRPQVLVLDGQLLKAAISLFACVAHISVRQGRIIRFA